MKLSSISYRDFRNIHEEKLNFSDGVNVLWGPNAQGKSNMLEGIYFFARGRSFRGAKERELCRIGTDNAGLYMEYFRGEDLVPCTLEAYIPAKGKKSLKRNGARLSGVREMIGSFCAVLFCPSHLSLVSGGPAVRRSFTDIALSQLYPGYLQALARYNRALLQRGALIKAAQTGTRADRSMWEVYAGILAQSGAQIAAGRLEYITELSEKMNGIFSEMTNGAESPSVTYQSHALPKDAAESLSRNELIQAMETRLYEGICSAEDRDIRLGATSFGIHKDDAVIKLNGRDAKVYASQGQQRSLALAMKLCEGELARKRLGEYPVFLLDDVLSELDSGRRAFVLDHLSGRQIVVTSCEPELFGRDGFNLIPVENGKIKRDPAACPSESGSV